MYPSGSKFLCELFFVCLISLLKRLILPLSHILYPCKEKNVLLKIITFPFPSLWSLPSLFRRKMMIFSCVPCKDPSFVGEDLQVSKFVFSIQGLVSESRSFDRATQHNKFSFMPVKGVSSWTFSVWSEKMPEKFCNFQEMTLLYNIFSCHKV